MRGSVQDEELLQSDFEASLEAHLAAGSFRAVIVLDEAPPELISLVGYLCNRPATPSTRLTNAGEFVDQRRGAGPPPCATASKRPVAAVRRGWSGQPPRAMIVRAHTSAVLDETNPASSVCATTPTTCCSARLKAAVHAGVGEDRLAAWWGPGLRDRVLLHGCRCRGRRPGRGG